jgi:hypothetical protein
MRAKWCRHATTTIDKGTSSAFLPLCELNFSALELNKVEIKRKKNSSSLYGRSVLAAWRMKISFLV